MVEVEIIRLAEEFELPVVLGSDDGGRAGPEAAVVDPGHVRRVVGEFNLDLLVRDRRDLLLLGGADVATIGGSIGGHGGARGPRVGVRRRERRGKSVKMKNER